MTDDITRYVRWRCPTCSKNHVHRYGAEECCPPDVDRVYVCPGCRETYFVLENAQRCEAECAHDRAVQARICPVCKTTHNDVESAVDCCLWKSLGYLERFRLRRQLESSIY